MQQQPQTVQTISQTVQLSLNTMSHISTPRNNHQLSPQKQASKSSPLITITPNLKAQTTDTPRVDKKKEGKKENVPQNIHIETRNPKTLVATLFSDANTQQKPKTLKLHRHHQNLAAKR